MSTQSEVIDSIYDRSVAKLRSQEDLGIQDLVRAYQEAQRQILNVIQDFFIGQDSWTLAGMQQAGRMQNMLFQITGILNDLSNQANSIITDTASQQFQDSYDHTSYALDQATPQDVDANYLPPDDATVRVLVNSEYEGAMFSQRIGFVTDAMASDIRDQLVQSMIQGESMVEASSRVRDIFGAYNLDNPSSYTSRARMIARTEIMRAQNLARSLSYEHNSAVMDGAAVWLVTPDDRLCPWCMRREGKDQDEISKMPKGEDPFGKKNQPPLHPHCRCTLAPNLKSWRDLTGLDMPEDFQDDERGIRSEDGKWRIAPVQSFNKWMSQKTSLAGV